MILYMFCVGGS